MPTLSLLPLLLLFLLFRPLAITVAVDSDVAVLLEKIKPALQGDSRAPNTQLATWNLSTPLCLWRGLRWSTAGGKTLRCDSPETRSNLSLSTDASLQLVSLRLPAAALSGSLPPEIGAFSFLDSVFLAANSLSGSIPLEIGNSPSISRLDLAANSLSGHVPPSIWNLCDRLIDLRLHGNHLSGELPTPAIPNSTCDSLRLLDLGDNRFDGEFPLFITNFVGLEQLDLGGNRFTGPVPEQLSEMGELQSLNLSYNNFSGKLPPEFEGSHAHFGAEAFQGNNPTLCGLPLRKCESASGLGSGAIAGIVIGLMAGAVVVASVSIGWAQGRRNRTRREGDEEGAEEVGGDGGEGKLLVFQGGEHLTLEDVLNATGQVTEKTAYGTVYKAKLSDGGNIELRLLREGSCKDSSDCVPAIRRLGRARHENLVSLRAFYQGKRGEKLLIYDYFPITTLHDLLHESATGRPILSWPRRHKIAVGAARALAYLHAGHDSAPIIHGNVRSKNVLVDEFFVPRLTEFGIDKLTLPAVADCMVATAKADGYKAPELQSMKKCNPRTDVYAFGILLLELLMGKKPGRGGADLPSLVKLAVLEETTMEVFETEVMKGVRSPAEEGLVQALKLAMGCCAPVPSARPDMTEVVRQLEENRPKNRSALYSPTETRSEIGTPF